jgi:hypothetical protein
LDLAEVYGTAQAKVVPLKLFKVKGFWAIVAVGCVSQMTFFSFNLFLPQIAQFLFSSDNITIGLIAVSSHYILHL